MYDDIVVKLPVLILYGSEDDWGEDERNRMIGDQDAFGHHEEEQQEDLVATNEEDVVLECLDETDGQEQSSQDDEGDI